MPFWPSFSPWAKLTPPQVPMRTARIHHGGRSSPTGGVYSLGERKTAFMARRMTAAPANPRTGDTSRASPVSISLSRLTDLNFQSPFHRLLATPTPTMLPMSVCELDTGSPRYQVPRFQMTPASSSDSTMTRAAPVRLSTSRSTGSRLTMPKATAVPPSSTPRKLRNPLYSTA